MCGIIGTAGALTGKTDKILKNLLIVDSLRGVDSTGIAAVDRQGETRVVKQIGNPFNLFDMKSYDTTVNRLNRVVIGHNRYATQGQVNKKNAHPFDFDNLVGVHNGTLHNKHKLKDSAWFQVDSENLYWHIQEEGLDSFLDIADGAWSLVWWDKEEEKLNFLRNKERPMWLCLSKAEDVLVWASEKWMLEAACSREDIVFNEPVMTQADELYSFPIGADAKIGKPHLRPAAGKYKPPVYLDHRNFRNGQPQTGITTTTVGTDVCELPYLKQQHQQQVIPFRRKGPAEVIPKQVLTVKDNYYADKKDVLLECLAGKTDKHGARYVICYDPNNRAAQIRLYLKAYDKFDSFIQKEIIATVGPKFADGMEGIYHKVEYSTVRLNIDKPDDEEGGKYFLDGKGTLISKAAWADKYRKGCAWCTAPTFPEDANRFTQEGDIICPSCAEDSEIAKYVTFK